MINAVRRMLVILTLGAGASATAQTSETVFRVGAPGAPQGCHSASDAALSKGLSAYAAHLETRLGVPAELCGVAADNGQAALAQGSVDLALVSVGDPALAENPPVAVRPIMRARQTKHLARTEFVLVGPAETPKFAAVPPTLEASLVSAVAANSTEAEALSTILGVEATDVSISVPFAPAISAAVASRAADGLIALNVGRYTIFCQETPGACANLAVVWRGFAPLSDAWSVAPDMDKERRYRLIGLHAVLHLERPDAFAAIAGDAAAEFEPTEPWAFSFRNTLD